MSLWRLLARYWYVPLFLGALCMYPAIGMSWLVSRMRSQREHQLTAKSQRTWERWLKRSRFMSPSHLPSETDLDELYIELQQSSNKRGLRYGLVALLGGLVGLMYLAAAWQWLSGPESAWLFIATMGFGSSISASGAIWASLSLPTRSDISFASAAVYLPPLSRIWAARWLAVLMLLPGFAVTVIFLFLTATVMFTPHIESRSISTAEPSWAIAVIPFCFVVLAATEVISLVRLTDFPAFRVRNNRLSVVASLTWKADHLSKFFPLPGILGLAQWHLLYPTSNIASSPILMLIWLAIGSGSALGMAAYELPGSYRRQQKHSRDLVHPADAGP